MAPKALTQYRFVVAGHGAFPLDMLRYDRATPATETDSHIILQQVITSAQANVTIALLGPKPPTEPRWSSYGWRVTEVVPQQTGGTR
jgi:hypothetical protein